MLGFRCILGSLKLIRSQKGFGAKGFSELDALEQKLKLRPKASLHKGGGQHTSTHKCLQMRTQLWLKHMVIHTKHIQTYTEIYKTIRQIRWRCKTKASVRCHLTGSLLYTKTVSRWSTHIWRAQYASKSKHLIWCACNHKLDAWI